MTRRKTHAEFVAQVETLVGDDYEVLGEYAYSNKKILIKHNECGTEYKTTPNNFLKGNRCPKCSGKLRKNTSMFKEEVRTLTGSEYSVLGEYVSDRTKILVNHNECGTEYKTTPNNFLKGNRCPKCFGKLRKNTSMFKEEVKALVCNDYSVLGEYVATHTKISIKHNECGTEYEVRPNDFLRGIRCPKCSESKGEKAVSNFLIANSIENKREFTLNGCADKRLLPFDFAILSGRQLTALIEYDGELHYVAKNFFGGETALRETQRRDAIKTRFCADNGIPLIRIPYWDFDNIETILTEKLLPLLKDADKHNAS